MPLQQICGRQKVYDLSTRASLHEYCVLLLARLLSLRCTNASALSLRIYIQGWGRMMGMQSRLLQRNTVSSLGELGSRFIHYSCLIVAAHIYNLSILFSVFSTNVASSSGYRYNALRPRSIGEKKVWSRSLSHRANNKIFVTLSINTFQVSHSMVKKKVLALHGYSSIKTTGSWISLWR